MCKFCKDELFDNGEVCNKFASQSIGLGKWEDVWSLEAWLMVDPDDDRSSGPRLNLSLTETSTGDDIEELIVPIKYCPFCGREL